MEDRPSFTPQEQAQARQMVGGMARQGCGGCLKQSVLIVGILAVAAIGFLALDDIVAPWAWDFPPGHGTLTGEWVGSFDLPAGQHGALYLSLSHNSNHDFDQGSRIGGYKAPLDGSAQSCIGTSNVQLYTLDGGADSGAVAIGLGFSRQKPTLVGYAFDDLKGAWQGDTLTLSGVFTRVIDAQGSTESAEEPNQRQPTTITLHRGKPADFQALCRPMG